MYVCTQSHMICFSHMILVGLDVNNNGGILASECSQLIKSLNFYVFQHPTSITFAEYEENTLLIGMIAFNEGANTVELEFRSLNVPMEISIGDLTF